MVLLCGNDGSRLGHIFVSQVRSGQPPLGLLNFPGKFQIFQLFSLRAKKSHRVRSKNIWVKDGSALINCGLKVCLGRVRPGPIFTVWG